MRVSGAGVLGSGLELVQAQGMMTKEVQNVYMALLDMCFFVEITCPFLGVHGKPHQPEGRTWHGAMLPCKDPLTSSLWVIAAQGGFPV